LAVPIPASDVPTPEASQTGAPLPTTSAANGRDTNHDDLILGTGLLGALRWNLLQGVSD
jgi:hypothetical protein